VDRSALTQTPSPLNVLYILDRSGSMSPVWDDALGGLNTNITQLKEDYEADGIPTRLTIIHFDDTSDLVEQENDQGTRVAIRDMPIQDVLPLTRAQTHPRGGTALNDAIMKGLSVFEAKAKPGDRNVVVISTDGAENSSKEYRGRSADVRAKIKDLEETGLWTFVFMNASPNEFLSAGYGVSAGNTVMLTPDQTSMAYASLSSVTRDYRRSVKSAVDNESFMSGTAGQALDIRGQTAK
jgi:hypothetical protein